MLTYLQIKNFTIIDHLALEFFTGMTVLTGETGAGKSLLIDTLNLILGGRTDSKNIRYGMPECEIIANFSTEDLPAAKAWLLAHDIASDSECIIRRVFTTEGRSRSYINGVLCPLQLLRELGTLLVNIHGQYDQHSLLHRDEQLKLLDVFAGHTNLAAQVETSYLAWNKLRKELLTITALNTDDGKCELLRYQIDELCQLNLSVNEFEELQNEFKQLANAEELIKVCASVEKMLDAPNLHESIRCLGAVEKYSPNLATIKSLLNNACIQVVESQRELQGYMQNIEINTDRLAQVEERLNIILALARKHHVKPENLYDLQISLTQELKQIETAKEHSSLIELQLAEFAAQYEQNAQKLSESRKQIALKLSEQITEKMQLLSMHGAQFMVNFTQREAQDLHSNGFDQIEFMVATNPGQPMLPLSKIASGGELSRLSLAIQVITAQKYNTATLIFDEVDTGIGGKTAEIVGRLLRQLANNTQVICVTHLPQVAAYGQHHLLVSKEIKDNDTLTKIQILQGKERSMEIARMLGGIKITTHTISHAEEMLKNGAESSI